ncbi:UbiX family flavin prenyltransferase [Novipirellula artificiosorum]|uniref:Flavin prenyltransferase UbiX n=1 Tax=Novipirellula artificiosorum TaxID=2528016 RepID=A0A5C6D6J7_9BACT|nr:flavin prenyltransferase UbiX [Novipirellula artificiosorum]TWU32813.1 putative aromatic acid decarboxylase [Novipirellula artificiosorum]
MSDLNQDYPVVLAMTGASGAIYGVRLLQLLSRSGTEVHLTISPSGAAVIRQELDLEVDLNDADLLPLLRYVPKWSNPTGVSMLAGDLPAGDLAAQRANIHYHRYNDYFTPIASGSFRTSAMVVCPCSGSTLSGIAHASASNLIQRAAEVHLKEHRRLVLVPRETPLSVMQLENMQRVAAAGAVMLPAMPGWYHGVDSLDSLVDFIVSRILDQIGVDNSLIGRWGEA